MTRLFVYGTLMPGQARWHLFAHHTESAPQNAEVCGRLFDTGNGWPAAVFGGDDPTSLVPGVLVAINPSTERATLELLDEIECVTTGLFGRVDVITAAGTPCSAYSWRGPTVWFDRIRSWADGSQRPLEGRCRT